MHNTIMFEAFESRRLMAGVSFDNGIINVTCTGGRDRVYILDAGDVTVVRTNMAGYERSEFTSELVVGARVAGEGGNDFLHLGGFAKPAIVRGGPGRDNIVGGAGNDTLIGNAGSDRIRGNDGDDLIGGLAGNDQLRGGGGNDVLVGGSSRDALYGAGGNDVFYTRDARVDRAFGGEDFDEIIGPDDGDLDEDIEETRFVAADDRFEVRGGGATIIDVLANDLDPTDDFTDIVAFTQPANGTVTQDPDTGELTYTPRPGFAGTDTFTYTIDDGVDGTSTATVTVDVLGAQPGPGGGDPGQGPGTGGGNPGPGPGGGGPAPGGDPGPGPGSGGGSSGPGSGGGGGSPGQDPGSGGPGTTVRGSRLTLDFRDFRGAGDPSNDDLTRFSRGEGFAIVGIAKDDDGRVLANVTIEIEVADDRRPGVFNRVGLVTTGSDGRYSLETRVPVSPAADNNRYRAVFAGNHAVRGSTSAAVRLPISAQPAC